MCIRASVWVRSCICVRSIHTPFDDSHLLLSLSLRWLFGKINMNVRHILGSATQPNRSYAVPSLLYPHFFLRIQISNLRHCIGEHLHASTREYVSLHLSILKLGARMLLLLTICIGQESFLRVVEIQVCIETKYPFKTFEFYCCGPYRQIRSEGVNDFSAI